MLVRPKLTLAIALAAMPVSLCSCGGGSDSAPTGNPATDSGVTDAISIEDRATDAGSDATQADGDPTDAEQADGDLIDAVETDSAKPDAPQYDGGPINQADYPAVIAAAICDNIGACCAAHGYQNNDPMCRVQIQGTYQELVDGLTTSSGVTYD